MKLFVQCALAFGVAVILGCGAAPRTESSAPSLSPQFTPQAMSPQATSPQTPNTSPKTTSPSSSAAKSNQQLFDKYVTAVRAASKAHALEDSRLPEIFAKRAAKEQAFEEFCKASRKFDELGRKACLANGDVAVDFAPVHAAKLEVDRLLAACNTTQQESAKVDEAFKEIRSERFRTADVALIALNALNREIERQLNFPSGTETAKAQRALEVDFVNSLASIEELAPRIKTFEEALTKLEQVDSAYALATEESRKSDERDLHDSFQKKLADLASKPVDASTAAAYEALRAEGRNVVPLEEKSWEARRKANSLYEELKTAQFNYRQAFEQLAGQTK